MYQPIVPGSSLHRTCIELYQRHHNAGTGTCAACDQPTPCFVRNHAALVLRTAGDDPHRYDEHRPVGQRPDPPALGAATPRPPATGHPSLATPGVTGFHLGGHGRRAHVAYTEYER